MRQSGERAARHGPISRAGQAHARGLLIEAAHTAIRTPGPLRAFHARLAARRGKQIALCATARKLAVLAWHLLSKDEDYRYGAPTITQRKLRALQRQAHDPGSVAEQVWAASISLGKARGARVVGITAPPPSAGTSSTTSASTPASTTAIPTGASS